MTEQRHCTRCHTAISDHLACSSCGYRMCDRCQRRHVARCTENARRYNLRFLYEMYSAKDRAYLTHKRREYRRAVNAPTRYHASYVAIAAERLPIVVHCLEMMP